MVLHHLDMAAKSRSLFAEDIDLVEFLVVQIVSLSSSLVVEVEVVGEPVIIESSDLPPMAGEVMSLHPFPVVSLAPPPGLVVGSVTPPALALELHAAGKQESFKAKPPDLAAWVACLKGLAVKCCHRTIKLPVPHHCLRHRLANSSRHRMVLPRLCSLRPLLGFSAAPPPVCFDVSISLLRSAWHMEGGALHSHVRCHE
jgi:hypothetical protein